MVKFFYLWRRECQAKYRKASRLRPEKRQRKRRLRHQKRLNMRNVTMTFSAAFALCFVPELFSGDLAWYISIFCRDIQVCLVTAFSIMSLPKSRVDVKSICLAFLIYAVVEAQLGLLKALSGFNLYDSMWYIITFIGGGLYLFNRYKQFSYPSDRIKYDNKIYLCFWKPKLGLSLAASLIGLPFGGMSIYTGTYLYGFRWRSPVYLKEKITSSVISRKFTVVDTGVEVTEEITEILNSLQGAPAGKFRTRCMSTITPVLKKMGGKFVPSLIERFPSLYANKVLNDNSISR